MLSYLTLAAAEAWAMAPQQGEGGAQGGASTFILMGGFVLIFYFLLFRPQKKQQKERQNMLDSIKKGDRIQTSGGLIGEVTSADPKELTVRIAPEVRVKIARIAIAAVIRKGSEGPGDKAPEAEKSEKTDKTEKTD